MSNTKGVLSADSLPAASKAETVYENIPCGRFLSSKLPVLDSPTFIPSLNTLYSVTPTSSEAAFHLSLTDWFVLAVRSIVTFEGAEGGVTSDTVEASRAAGAETAPNSFTVYTLYAYVMPGASPLSVNDVSEVF